MGNCCGYINRVCFDGRCYDYVNRFNFTIFRVLNFCMIILLLLFLIYSIYWIVEAPSVFKGATLVSELIYLATIGSLSIYGFVSRLDSQKLLYLYMILFSTALAFTLNLVLIFSVFPNSVIRFAIADGDDTELIEWERKRVYRSAIMFSLISLFEAIAVASAYGRYKWLIRYPDAIDSLDEKVAKIVANKRINPFQDSRAEETKQLVEPKSKDKPYPSYNQQVWDESFGSDV